MKHAVTYSVFLLCCLVGICSCRKNYTCTCQETIIGHAPATVSANFNQEKKTDAQQACDAMQNRVGLGIQMVVRVECKLE